MALTCLDGSELTSTKRAKIRTDKAGIFYEWNGQLYMSIGIPDANVGLLPEPD